MHNILELLIKLSYSNNNKAILLGIAIQTQLAIACVSVYIEILKIILPSWVLRGVYKTLQVFDVKNLKLFDIIIADGYINS